MEVSGTHTSVPQQVPEEQAWEVALQQRPSTQAPLQQSAPSTHA